MLLRFLWIGTFVVTALTAGRAFAQATGADTAPWQTGVFIGRALPHGVSQNDDIFTIWGLRLSVPMSGSHGGYFDGSFFSGNGSTVSWQGLDGGVSLQVPVETIAILAGIGVDVTRYSSDITSSKIVFGEHFIGGIMTHLSQSLLARFDLKFNSAPGTTVMFAIGIVYDF